jgi:hypothetical protein
MTITNSVFISLISILTLQGTVWADSRIVGRFDNVKPEGLLFLGKAPTKSSAQSLVLPRVASRESRVQKQNKREYPFS